MYYLAPPYIAHYPKYFCEGTMQLAAELIMAIKSHNNLLIINNMRVYLRMYVFVSLDHVL